VCSALSNDDKSYVAEPHKPLPSIAASVPRSRISSTLPAFTIPVADSRMSSTLPANSTTMKPSLPGAARRGLRRKDANRRDCGNHLPGRSKHRVKSGDKPDEIVLRVVPIDISGDDSHSSCQQESLVISGDEAQSADGPGNEDDSDMAPQQFERTAAVRQGKFFRKSSRRCVSDAATDVLRRTNDECPKQVRTLVVTAAAACLNSIT